jgi:hypothetical protein
MTVNPHDAGVLAADLLSEVEQWTLEPDQWPAVADVLAAIHAAVARGDAHDVGVQTRRLARLSPERQGASAVPRRGGAPVPPPPQIRRASSELTHQVVAWSGAGRPPQ